MTPMTDPLVQLLDRLDEAVQDGSLDAIGEPRGRLRTNDEKAKAMRAAGVTLRADTAALDVERLAKALLRMHHRQSPPLRGRARRWFRVYLASPPRRDLSNATRWDLCPNCVKALAAWKRARKCAKEASR